MGQKVLFAVHDWGLGHATRDLVLIRGLLGAGNQVTILSTGRALRLLQDELGDSCDFLELKDIPKPLSRYSSLFYMKMSLALPAVFQTFRNERNYVAKLCKDRRFDRIVSDSRFGVANPEVPSFYLFHSLRQIIPGRPRALEHMVEFFQKRMLRRVDRILVPDEADGGLAGDLCHDVQCDWGDALEYIGILSSVEKQPLEADVDVFITISGAEPQRTIFEEIVMKQVWGLEGRVVVTRGRPELPNAVEERGQISVYSYMNREQQQRMMNRARLVVSRSGYTTLMELAELHKRALFVPTVGQSEQEYLAAYHKEQGHAHAVHQSRLDLARDVTLARRYSGLPAVPPTSQSVQRFLTAIGC